MVARVVYAARGSEKVRVHVPGVVLPVIVVPEFMGTRLADPGSHALVWNPLGSPFGNDSGAFTANVSRLANLSAALVPNRDVHYETPSQEDQLPDIENAYAMVTAFYGALATALQPDHLCEGAASDAQAVFRTFSPRLPLYFFGYDWRQDLTRTALALAEFVERVVEATGGEKVVLVAHGMGGTVCRYYCRALGGEGRTHQLFLVGSGILGVPEAYEMLKHGLPGVNLGDLRDTVDELVDASQQNVDEGAEGEHTGTADGAAVAGALTFAVAEQFPAAMAFMARAPQDAAAGFFGALTQILSMGAGRALRREDTRTLLRSFPSLYQSMPGRLYCAAHPHWVIFDPLATGIAPTGFMVAMPALHVLGVALDLGFNIFGNQLGNPVASAFDRLIQAQQASGRSSRNAISLSDLLRRVEEALVALPQTGLLDIPSETIRGLKYPVTGAIAQVKRLFTDASSPGALYRDIFVGLLDRVDERAACTAGLALRAQLDDVLTVGPEPDATIEPGFMETILRPLIRFGLAFPLLEIPMIATQERQDQEAAALETMANRAKLRKRLQRRPAAYVPPGSYAVYGTNSATRCGAAVIPLAFVSQDDTNVVRSQFFPIAPLPSEQALLGDGTVSQASARPAAAQLTTDFIAEYQADGVEHLRLLTDTNVLNFLKNQLAAGLDRLVKGEVLRPPPPSANSGSR